MTIDGTSNENIVTEAVDEAVVEAVAEAPSDAAHVACRATIPAAAPCRGVTCVKRQGITHRNVLHTSSHNSSHNHRKAVSEAVTIKAASSSTPNTLHPTTTMACRSTTTQA